MHFTKLIMFCTLFAATVWSGNTLAQQSQPAQTPATTKLSIATPPAGYKCVKGSPSYCKCDGIEDCLALDDSGKCTGEIQDNGSGGTCSSDGAGKPASPQRKNLTAKQTTTAKTASAKSLTIPKGPDRYGCEYDSKTHKKIGCICDSISDCISLKNSGDCDGKPITETEEGVGQC